MTAFIIAIHVIACSLLITLILIQRGRGGGLVDSFSGVESMFGTKTNTFLTRTTAVLAVMFFFTCLSLAILSVKQSRSLMGNIKPQAATARQTLPLTSQPTPSAQQQAAPGNTQETPKN